MYNKLLPELKISYDPEADAMYVKISEGNYVESDEIKKDIIVDYDENWKVIWIEILNASKKDIFKYLFWWELENVINIYKTSSWKI